MVNRSVRYPSDSEKSKSVNTLPYVTFRMNPGVHETKSTLDLRTFDSQKWAFMPDHTRSDALGNLPERKNGRSVERAVQ